ncbi:hypothetical protein ACFPME_12115 [Rhodanobacter umsongensis]|uniref:Sel1 repeat family protein n=1 Tax=Rhodanobacter umsongensis TaxID=633153 RepID=A0ABW0JNB6_9GAMM
MNTKRFSVLLVGVAAVSATAWLYVSPFSSAHDNSRSAQAIAPAPVPAPSAAASAPSPSPPTVFATSNASHPGTPAATMTFDTSRDCYFAKNRLDGARSVIKACQSLPQIPQTESQRAECSNSIARSEVTIRELTDTVAACPADTASAMHFYEATKLAAAQGNADAQACYVQSLFQSNGVQLTYPQREIDDYRRDAPRYISDGLARGDWRMVSLLARGGHDGDGLLPLIAGNDVYREYVMNRLLQLGADGEYAHQLEASIRFHYLSPSTTQAPPLTQEQIARGNQEATALFHKSFDRQPLLNGPPSVCAQR